MAIAAGAHERPTSKRHGRSYLEEDAVVGLVHLVEKRPRPEPLCSLALGTHAGARRDRAEQVVPNLQTKEIEVKVSGSCSETGDSEISGSRRTTQAIRWHTPAVTASGTVVAAADSEQDTTSLRRRHPHTHCQWHWHTLANLNTSLADSESESYSATHWHTRKET